MDSSFAALGVADDITKKLSELGFTVPTPIQAMAIPSAMEGKDIIGVAQTGTGKTLAFGLPLIQRLSDTHGKGLVILPTRELAEQVDAALFTIGRSFGLRTALVIGGAAMGRQIMALRRRPNIIIGTPGRIVDHLQNGNLRLNDVTMLVLDEADRMLDMGFAPQVNTILEQVPAKRQTMLFSATMPQAIERIAATHLNQPTKVQLSETGTVATNVSQELHVVGRQDKTTLLSRFLDASTGPVLVFTRTKHGARKLCQALNETKQSAAEIHGNRTQSQRREALQGFKSGRYQILVATDVAARGIDVNDIELVINYDLPDQPEDYVHRIGRTARAGKSGRAISFASPDQVQLVRSIERLLKQSIPRAQGQPGMTNVSFAPAAAPSRLRSSYSRRTDQGARPDYRKNRYSSSSRPKSNGYGGGYSQRRPSGSFAKQPQSSQGYLV